MPDDCQPHGIPNCSICSDPELVKRIANHQPKQRGRKPGLKNKAKPNGHTSTSETLKPFGARLMKIEDIPKRIMQPNDPEVEELFKILETLKPRQAYAIPAKNSTVKVLAGKLRRWIRVRKAQAKYATSSSVQKGEVYIWLQEDKARP